MKLSYINNAISRISWSGTMRDNGGAKIARFTSSGHLYYVAFMPEENESVFQKPTRCYTVEFNVFRDSKGPMKSGFTNSLKTSMLGAVYQPQGANRFDTADLDVDSRDVLHVVSAAVVKFLETVKPIALEWSCVTHSRHRFFHNLISKIGKVLPYQQFENGGEYILVRENMLPLVKDEFKAKAGVPKKMSRFDHAMRGVDSMSRAALG
jgi:hypothetical protein